MQGAFLLLLCNRIITCGILKSILSSAVLPAVSYRALFVLTEQKVMMSSTMKLNYSPGKGKIV